MEPLSTKIKAIAERCRERQDDPEFQARAAENEADTAEQLERSRETERQNRLLVSGVPARFWEHLRAPRDTEALAAARRFLDAPPACAFMTLVGPRGRGKSFAAAWSVAQRPDGIYVPNAQDLVAAGAFANIWRDMRDARVLAVDEIGTEYLNDAYSSSLYALLNSRYLEQRKTVLVSNLDAHSLKRRFVDAGLDRLLERIVTGGIFENVPGESMRQHWSAT